MGQERQVPTTTIQKSLLKPDKVNEDILSKDSFTFIDKIHTCVDSDCDVFVNSKSCETTFSEFQNRLEELRLSKMNVILSSEKLARELLKEKKIFQLKNITKGWNVRVVGTYRRYFEWYLSDYDQAQHNRFSNGQWDTITTLVEVPRVEEMIGKNNTDICVIILIL